MGKEDGRKDRKDCAHVKVYNRKISIKRDCLNRILLRKVERKGKGKDLCGKQDGMDPGVAQQGMGWRRLGHWVREKDQGLLPEVTRGTQRSRKIGIH
jgi:hypothetical protein